MNTGQFARGNKAAAKPSKKAVASMILNKLETEADSLSPAQFTQLVSRYSTLTTRRRRHRKKAEAEKVSHSALDSLPPEEQEMFREVYRIEAERLEAGRKKWREEQEGKQKERGDSQMCPSPPVHDQANEKPLRSFRLVPDV
jgi:hypothetical protein